MNRAAIESRRLKIGCVVLALIIITLLYVTGNELLSVTADYIWQKESGEEAAVEKIVTVRKTVAIVFIACGILATFMCLLLYHRQKSRNALKAALEKYENLVNNTKDIVYIHDMEGNFTFFSKSCEDMTGFKEEDFLGKHFSSVLAPESQKITRRVFEEQLKGKDVEPYEIVIFDKDKNRITLLTDEKIVREGDKIIGVQGFAKNITVRIKLENRLKEVNEKLERQLEWLAVLNDLDSKMVSTSFELSEIFDDVMELCVKAIPSDSGSLMLLDEKSGKLTIEASTGLRDDIVKSTVLEIGERIAGWVVKYREPLLLIRSLKNDPRFKDLPGREEIKSAISVPLMMRGKIIGVLNVNNITSPVQFTKEDLEFVITLANQGAVAIEGARLYTDLRKTNLELSKLDKNRTEFMSHVSHEFRTPLTSLMESLSLVLDGTLGKVNREQEDFLALAQGEVKRLTRLVRELLDISRIEAGKMEIRKRPINIDFIVKKLQSEVLLRARKKRISLESELPQHLPVAYGDHDRTIQILTNLVDNAIKYTSEGGKVSLKAEGDEYIKVTVTDTGVGIAPENLDKIFEKFSSFGKSASGARGAGLGLAITKELVELQGGEINVETEVGKGSKFTFTIPQYRIALFSAEHLNDEIERAKDREKKEKLRKSVIMLLVIRACNLKETHSVEEAGEFLKELGNVLKGVIRYPYDLIDKYGDDGLAIIFNEVAENKISAIEERVEGSYHQEHKFASNLDIRQYRVVYPDDGSSGQELLRRVEKMIREDSG